MRVPFPLITFLLGLVSCYFLLTSLLLPDISNSVTELSTTQVAKYEIFTDLLVVFLALAGVIGGGVYLLLRSEVSRQVDMEADRVRSLINVRINLYRQVDNEKEHKREIEDILLERKEISKELPGWLISHIESCKITLKQASNLDPKKDKEGIVRVKNNLIYALTIAKTDKEIAMKLTREVFEESSDGFSTDHHWMHTYAWFLYRFAITKEEKQKAIQYFVDELYNRRKKYIIESDFLEKLERHLNFFKQQLKKF